MTNNIRLTDVLGDDASYCGDDSAAALEGLPAAAWPALVAACDEMGCGDAPGIDCAVAKTNETIDDFDASRAAHWSEPGRRSELDLAGRRAVMYERCQLRRGDQRLTQIVVDCGDSRAVLSI